MSENKHVQNEELWNKTSSSTPSSTSRLPYNTVVGPTSAHMPTFAQNATTTTTNHAEMNFSAARFQAPSLHQQHAINSTLTHMVTSPTPNFAHQHHHHHHHATPSIASPNVPVYPVAATSVLPNHFANVANATATATTPTALHQLFQAMNSAAVASLNTSPRAVVTATSASSPSIHTTIGNRTVSAPDLPSPSSNSSAGVASTSGFHGNSSGNGTSVSSGAITATVTENVLNAISGLTQQVTPARNMGLGVKPAPDEEKLRRVHQMVAAGVSENAKQQIVQILDCISTLKPVERLLLYLRLPGAAPETDPLRQPQNPLGTRSEINHTINWVRSHLEQDPNVSIPKQDVYNDYIAYCERLDIKPLSTADFGKVMKQVFPGIRPRRLGTRGHSRYCYAAMRKTTKLASPQLPQLISGINKGVESTTEQFENISTAFSEQNSETWNVIKTWAENVLQVKLEDAKDLANLIKAGNLPSAIGGGQPAGSTSRTSIAHKKFGNREAKEKRLLTDMGPLKKRRKKKRKGSSSSESSYSSQPPLKQNSNNKEPVQSIAEKIVPASTAQLETIASSSAHPNELIGDDEKLNLIKVKEEFIELSPNYQRLQLLTPPDRHATAAAATLENQQQQPQTLPINLAPEQRTVLARAPSAISAFNTAAPSASHSRPAAKNLVPKIMELANTNAVNNESISLTDFQHTSPVTIVPTIKEEEIDDYSTSNILCKKVRKAQQTKGVWQQTTSTATTATAPSHIVPVIITSSSTPTPQQDTTNPNTVSGSITANTPSPNYLMGPPAPASSTSPFAMHTDSTGHLTPTPKVASRNMLQLRAKRLQISAAAAAAAAADSNPTDELPENLGLPRERVISICNMDKHELDDYFINGEEEEEDNSNDQDTELLQYFQTGDAEEKLNSLDAGKQRNPTVATAITNTNTTTTIATNNNNKQQQQHQNVAASSTSTIVVNSNLPLMQKTAITTTTTICGNSVLSNNVNTLKNVLPTLTRTTTMIKTLPTTITTTTKATVGSASASLAFMSQKHQQNLNQQQHQQQHQQQQKQVQFQEQQQQQHQQNVAAASAAAKRKIPPSGPIIKHYTFAPISPNIQNNGNLNNSFLPSNTTTTNGAGSAPVSGSNDGLVGNSVFFASPGLTPPMRLRPKPAFGKQQSLDIDLASSLSFPASAMNSMHDPMIGATRRRRNYANVTSASAPPSPSLMHQQQLQHMFNPQHFQNVNNNPWQSLLSSSTTSSSAATATAATVNPNSASFLNDQNSLDLDLFGTTNAANNVNNNTVHFNAASIDAAGNLTFDDYVTETQRSQSVPLSQLQRIHSPPRQNSFNNKNVNQQQQQRHHIDFGAENSLLGSSENSCSQHSNNTTIVGSGGGGVVGGTNIIKLEDPTTTADVIATDQAAALLDGVDVSEILSSPDFVQNFTSIAQKQGNIIAATTTCSSAGSSSGYSSGACTTFSSTNNIISRSVSSTPLPHHHQNLFGQSSINFYNHQRRRSGFINDLLQLSPDGNAFINNNTNMKSITNNNISSNGSHNNNNNNNNCSSQSFSNTFGSRSIYDISKSMPTTPITTPSFRYSPEFNRDFLINGNTIDDSISFGTVVGNDSLNVVNSVSNLTPHHDDDESVNLVSNLSADTLLTGDDVSVPGADDVLIGNL